VSFLDDYTNVPSLAYAANIFTGKIYRAGYPFKLFRVFAPYQDADVEIWFGSTAEINDSPVTVSFTASYDTFTEQSYNNSGESSEGDARFVIRASAPVIVGFSQYTSSTTWTGGSDQQILVPPSNKVLMPNFSGANKQVSLLDPNGSSSTVNETSPIDASYTTSTDTLLHVSGIGDGDGTDSQHGIPTVWTADHYALPIDLDYYQVSAIEPCVVKVYQISNGALLDTFDFTNASETNIETGSRGTIAGSTIASNGAYFVGTGRFSVYGNPTSTGDELTPHGWYSKLRTVVENPPTATITGATLVDAQGNVISDSVITNYEDSSTLKYNGQFTEFQTNGFPVGWDDIDGVYGTSTGVWSQHTGTNPDPLSGSSCLKYDYNGTSPASSFIVRQPSDKYALFPEPPKVNLTVAGNAVVVGSIDVYIESGFSQPGNPPQLLMDLVTAYNSPVEYFRRFVTADSSITDEWQRLYFITSQETSTVKGGATVGDPIIDIRAVIYPNDFQGVVFWDNLRFSILDPSVDNEQQLWQDIKGTYGSGVNMCISGWDSASSAEFISANIDVTDGSGAFSTAQGKFDGTSVLITATSGAPCIVYAADNSSDYNMPLQPSTSYIVSVYVRPSVQPATTFTVGIRQDNGTIKESANLRTDLVANQWTRVHALITTDSGVTSQGNIRILGDHSSSFTFYLDGLMVEEYLGGSPFSTGPSQFVKSGTFGATSGISLYSASGSILDDIDIRDDQKALTLLGGSIVPNAGFGDYYRVNRHGKSAPRHWYGSGSANAVQFLSDTQRDVVFIPQTSGLRYSSDAFSVNLDTEYEVAILARKSVGGDATRLRVRVQELESDMPTGKRFLSSVTNGSPPAGEDFVELQLADNTISLTNPNVAYASGTDWDLTTSFDIYYGTYTPSTSLVRWASIYFDAANNNPATGNLEVEWFTIRDKSTLGATAGTNLFANDGSVIKDSVITNFDDASALSFNPAFTNWTGGTPDGWTKAGTFTLNQGTDSLTGPYAVECVCTGANGGFISRHNNEDSPTITFDISGDAVLIGSVDVKISSYTSGTPGISADLMQSNSIYYRQVIPAGTGSSPPTGTWQRLYFKVSAYSNNVQGFGGTTAGANYVGVKIGLLCDVTTSNTSTGNTSAFTGTVIYDNVRFAIIDPALENEQQIWTDINDTPAGGVNLMPPGWDSIDSDIRATTMHTQGSPEFINTSPVLFDGTSIKLTGTNVFAYFATSAEDYNIYGIKPNTKYMLSAYVYPSIIGSSFDNFQIRLRQDDSSGPKAVNVRSQITAANAWTRVYGIVETDGNVTDSGVFTIYFSDGSSQTVYVDGIMVEEYLGGDDANAIPSAFTRSGTSGAPSGTYIGNVSSDAVAGTVDGTGSLGNVVADDGGGTYRHVVKGLFGGTANDGDSIAFTQTWNSPPSVLFGAGGRVDGGGVSPALTGDVYQDYKALNVTSTGFDASLKIKETVGTVTNRTDTTESVPSVPSGQDRSINKSVAAEAFDDNYTYKYSITIKNGVEWFPNEYEPGSVTIGFYSNDGVNGWELRGTQTTGGIGNSQEETYNNITKVISVDGLGLNDDWAVTLESSTFAGSTLDDFVEVTYGTATAPTEASATDNAAPIPFIVLGD
jgi:hypothetical protein